MRNEVVGLQDDDNESGKNDENLNLQIENGLKDVALSVATTSDSGKTNKIVNSYKDNNRKLGNETSVSEEEKHWSLLTYDIMLKHAEKIKWAVEDLYFAYENNNQPDTQDMRRRVNNDYASIPKAEKNAIDLLKTCQKLFKDCLQYAKTNSTINPFVKMYKLIPSTFFQSLNELHHALKHGHCGANGLSVSTRYPERTSFSTSFCVPKFVTSGNYMTKGVVSSIVANGIWADADFSVNLIDSIIETINLKRENCIIFDIGANIGTVTALFAKMNYQVFAIEADNDLYELLKKTFRNLELPINVMKFAMTDSFEGNFLEHFWNDKTENENNVFDTNKLLQDQNLDYAVLDDIYQSIQNTMLTQKTNRKFCGLKIDAEGADTAILKGGANLLNEIPVVLYKIKGGNQTIFESYELLKGKGFRLYSVNEEFLLNHDLSLPVKIILKEINEHHGCFVTGFCSDEENNILGVREEVDLRGVNFNIDFPWIEVVVE